uniref:Uncharacterized protein n=1 Tax=Anguilla anguilla TaxID=7936 RepID=A0A0E9RBC7_ANGAN
MTAFDTVLPQVGLSNLLHFNQYHRGDFFRVECFTLSFVFHFNFGLSSIADYLEGPVLHI